MNKLQCELLDFKHNLKGFCDTLVRFLTVNFEAKSLLSSEINKKNRQEKLISIGEFVNSSNLRIYCW